MWRVNLTHDIAVLQTLDKLEFHTYITDNFNSQNSDLIVVSQEIPRIVKMRTCFYFSSTLVNCFGLLFLFVVTPNTGRDVVGDSCYRQRFHISHSFTQKFLSNTLQPVRILFVHVIKIKLLFYSLSWPSFSLGTCRSTVVKLTVIVINRNELITKRTGEIRRRSRFRQR